MWCVNIARRAHSPLRSGAVNLRRVISFDQGDTRSILRFPGGNHVYISSAEEIPQFVQTEILPSTLRTVKLSRPNERGDYHYEGRVNTRAIPYVLPVENIDDEESYAFPTPKGMMYANEVVHDQFFLLVVKAEGGCVWVNLTFVDFVAFGEKRDTISVNGDIFRIKVEWFVRENLGCRC